MKDKCVLIGDLKNSRKIEKWKKVFSDLEKALALTNRKYKEAFVIPLKPTIGDEFQGAIHNPLYSYEIFSYIKSNFNENIYMGIGIGEIEKPFLKEKGMRGNAFYRARAAIEACKELGHKIIIQSYDEFNNFDLIVNTLLRNIESIENSWTKRQKEVINFYRFHTNYTYHQLSKNFKTSKQAIYEIIKASNWGLIHQNEEALTLLLTSGKIELIK